MTDAERIDWLEEDPDRLEDVRGHYNNSDPQVTVREAIDQMAEIQSR